MQPLPGENPSEHEVPYLKSSGADVAAVVSPQCLLVSRGSAVKFIKGIVSRFGVPNRIITDNGSQFTSNLFKTYCANLGTQICVNGIVWRP